MALQWELIHDLRGKFSGSPTTDMRSKTTTWLAKEKREQNKAYTARLRRTFLYAAYDDTIQKLVAKPFSRPVTLLNEESLPEPLQKISSNVDLEKTTLTQFFKQVFDDAVDHGLTHVLVDFPNTGGSQTFADEKEKDIRPYFIHIPPKNLISWRTARSVNGGRRLTQIRIFESKIVPKGSYGEEVIKIIRVINSPVEGEPGTWEIHGRVQESSTATPHHSHIDTTENYKKVDEGVWSYPGIPLITLYPEGRTDYMIAYPPLMPLAELNLAHYQTWSDKRNIEHIVGIAILFRRGFPEAELDNPIIVGGSESIGTTNPEADIKWVEHTGAGIETLQRSLLDLQLEMEVLGLQPLVQRSGNTTATARAMNEGKTDSQIQAWIRVTETFVVDCYKAAAAWIAEFIPEDFEANIWNEFGISMRAFEDLTLLLESTKEGFITVDTYLEEMKRRGVLNDSVDVQSEVKKAIALGAQRIAERNGSSNNKEELVEVK